VAELAGGPGKSFRIKDKPLLSFGTEGGRLLGGPRQGVGKPPFVHP